MSEYIERLRSEAYSQPDVMAPPAPKEESFADRARQEAYGVEEAPQEEDGFLGRSGDALSEMAGDVTEEFTGKDEFFDMSNVDPEIAAALGEATQGPSEMVQGALSDIFQTGSNILMDGGITMVKNLVPEEYHEDIKTFARDAWDVVATDPTVRVGLEALKSGAKAYSEWANENPDASSRLEEVVTIAPGIRAGTGKKVSWKTMDGETKTIATPGARKSPGTDQKRKAQTKQRNNRRAQVDQDLEPINREAGGGRMEPNKHGGGQHYAPDDWERIRNDEVVRVQGYDPKARAAQNRNVLEERVNGLRDKLHADIEKAGNPVIDRQKLTATFANRINAIDEVDFLSPNARDHAMKVYGQAQKLIDASDGTTMGLLQARRDLDKFVRGQKQNVFDADVENGLTSAMRLIRNTMNETVEEAVGPQVRISLNKQHRLLDASDLLDRKAYREADTKLGLMKEKLEQKMGMKFPTTPLAAGATAVGGVSMLGGYPVVGGILAAGGGSFMLMKALKSPKGPQIIAQMRKMADKNPILKPEVNALIQFAEDLGPDEFTEETTNE